MIGCRRRDGEDGLLLLESIWGFAQCVDDPQVTLLIQGAELGPHLIHQAAVGAGLSLLAGGGRLQVTVTGADPTLDHHIIPGVEGPTHDCRITTMSGEDLTPDLHPLTAGPLFGDARDRTRLPSHHTAHRMTVTDKRATLIDLFRDQEVFLVAQEGGRGEEATLPVSLLSQGEGGRVDDILAASPVAREGTQGGATRELFRLHRRGGLGRGNHLLDAAALETDIPGVLARMLVLDRCLGLRRGGEAGLLIMKGIHHAIVGPGRTPREGGGRLQVTVTGAGPTLDLCIIPGIEGRITTMSGEDHTPEDLHPLTGGLPRDRTLLPRQHTTHQTTVMERGGTLIDLFRQVPLL
ncbi:hypothetical protein LINGRAHAP2_LOCUS5974 [Linum grandiflorum]